MSYSFREAVFLVSLILADQACALGPNREINHHRALNDLKGICQTSTKQRDKQRLALYQAQTHPSASIKQVTENWRRDLHPQDIERYEPIQILGEGRQGRVVAAKDLHTEKLVAIKQVRNVFRDNTRSLKGLAILRELLLLRLLNSSDYVINIYHAFLPKNSSNFTDVYFVSELMDQALVMGKERFSQVAELSYHKQKILVHNALHALADMHELGIFHRDVTSNNIMGNSNCKFKLIDFGMATPEMKNVSVTGDLRYRAGTIGVRPMELLLDEGRTWKSSYDIWAMGCTLLKLLVGNNEGKPQVHQEKGRPPALCSIGKGDGGPMDGLFKRQAYLIRRIEVLGMPQNATLQKYHAPVQRMFDIVKSEVSSAPPKGLAGEYPGVSKELLVLLERMLAWDPEDRPSAKKLLKDPIFSKLEKRSGSKSHTTLAYHQVASKSASLGILTSPEVFISEEYNRKMIYNEIVDHYTHLNGSHHRINHPF